MFSKSIWDWEKIQMQHIANHYLLRLLSFEYVTVDISAFRWKK